MASTVEVLAEAFQQAGTPFIVAAIDAALAAQNAAAAAESMGLGTCYVGALRNDPERVAAELELPPRVMAVLVRMCLAPAKAFWKSRLSAIPVAPAVCAAR